MANDSSQRPIHIIGFGATGRLWASSLAESGHRVVAHGRRQTFPFVLQENNDRRWMLTKDDGEDFETALFCTKSYQLSEAIIAHRHRITQQTHIVIACNGMGYEDHSTLCKLLSPSQVFFLVHSHAAMRGTQKYGFIQTGRGEAWLGALHPGDCQRQKNLMDVLQCELLTGWSDDIESLRWRKLAVNALINPLSALLNCRNGALLANEIQPIWQLLANEITYVAERMGQSLSSAEIITAASKVASDTAQNFSSMHQDLHNGRKTEIDAINGFIVRQALKYKTQVPVNTVLTNMVRLAENQKLTKKTED